MSSKSHPTRRKLIETVLAMSVETDFEKITVDAVLKESGVSKGSLYYHFTDFPDLMGAAMAASFSIGVNRSIALMAEMLAKCQSKEDLLAGIRLSAIDTLPPEAVLRRLNRARIIGVSPKYPKLREHIAHEQARLTKAIEALFIEGQQKGWMKTDFDTHTAAVFIQSYTLGKILDDVCEQPVDNDNWIDMITKVAQSLFII